MTPTDLAGVLDWAADEGWNPGLGDAEAFHAADPGGFYLARIDGTPVAAISVVNHSESHAFLGLYLCRPEWRGQGIGMALWEHAIAHAGGRSIGLDGVPAQEANYRASGFTRTGATLRHVGRWPAGGSPAIRDLAFDDIPHLHSLDRAANGYARAPFMRAWLASDVTRGTSILEHDGQIAGFATWRACREGTKIGPIVAMGIDGATALVADIAHRRPTGPLIIDVPEANAPLRRALLAEGFEVPFTTARMWRGQAPITGQALQAIATMELG